MIGIGGGTPSSKDDIRLGDVVVSHLWMGRVCSSAILAKRYKIKASDQRGS
jgi:hypothetical protein